MKKLLQIANGVAFVSMVVVNYLSNTGIYKDTTIGEVSADLNNLFTPAGYAFSIWGVIYLLLLGFAIYQGRSLFVKVRDDAFVERTGVWFITSCLANIGWIFAWLGGYTGISLIFMFFLLMCLLIIVKKNHMELWDAPLSVIFFLWWPFVIYSGWITVASVANVAAYLTDISSGGWGLSEVFWTILMIIIAGVINLAITWTRNMREFALVGAWALIAIAVANWESTISVAYTALGVAIILFLSSSIHGYKNRGTSPFVKLKELSRKSQ